MIQPVALPLSFPSLSSAGRRRNSRAILADYPYLESEDITQTLEYAALLADDQYPMTFGQ